MNQNAEDPAGQAAAEPSPPTQYPKAVGIPNDPRQKSPVLAGLLSAMPGLGQVYTGYYQRGFIHAVVVAAVITLLASENLGPFTPLFGFFLPFFWLYNMLDAARRAALYNQALAGMSEIDLPEDFRVPGFRGTILGGALIAAAGFVLLLHTRFDYSLDWIEEWWPVALIAFGAYLIFKAWQERTRTAHRAHEIGGAGEPE